MKKHIKGITIHQKIIHREEIYLKVVINLQNKNFKKWKQKMKGSLDKKTDRKLSYKYTPRFQHDNDNTYIIRSSLIYNSLK